MTSILPPLLLAPMAGFTDAPMRMLCLRQGCQRTFTEMVDSEGLLRGSCRTLQLLETAPGEHSVVAHIFGNHPAVLAEATAKITALQKFEGIDLNAGCPVRKIMVKGSGAALMRDPEKLHSIVVAMRAATALPLTVKTRLGIANDAPLAIAVAQAVEAAGADGLTVHARFVAQGHRGQPDLNALAEICSSVKIPVIGNGGIRNGKDALRMLRETGVTAVMIGQSAMGAPWTFARLRAEMEGRDFPAPSADERRAALEEHLDAQVAHARHIIRTFRPRNLTLDAEGIACMRFRAHLFRYLHGLRGAADARRQLHTLFDLDAVHSLIDACFARERAFKDKPLSLTVGA